MHVMNCVSLVNDKENGAISVEAGLMIGDTTEPEEQPPPPPPLPCMSTEAGFSSAGVPPPPPPPPPPPAPSSFASLQSINNGRGQPSKKKRIRSFFWKTIPEEQVRGKNNIWTIGAKQNYQIDTKTIEEFFGQQEETASPDSRSRTSRKSFKDTKQEITILDAKRSMNIGIFLKQFKKSVESIMEDLHAGKSDLYSSEILRELFKSLPEAEEVKKLKDFSGDISKLCQADYFMYLLIQVPNYSLRIEAMVLKKEFSPSCTSLQKDMTIIRMATKELMCCEELHSILHLVLQAGNIMNAGGYAGNAVGFKLSSLLKLADTKANKPGMNLLHFVALEAQKKDKVLLSFSEKLQHVQEAARISLESIEAELQSLSVKTKSLKDNVRRDSELFRQMEGFLQFAVKELKELEHWKRDLLKETHALIDFLCEDKETMKLEECFQIFRDFCLRFNKAVKENKEREIQELQQLQRLKELEEKRRSSMAGELGAFGRSSSENDVGTLTKRGLEEFLPFLQQRPQSPSYRNSSIRRSRHSLGVTADRELLTFLETSQCEDPNKFSNLPQAPACQARPSMSWAESKESGDASFTNLRLDQASEAGTDCTYYQLPPSQSDHVANLKELATAHSNLYNHQESASKDKYRTGMPCMEATDPASWDVSLEECQLVPGMHKLDLHEAKSMEDPSAAHFAVEVRGLETLGDSGLYSAGDAVAFCRTSKETASRADSAAKVARPGRDPPEPNSGSPVSSDGSISGIKAHRPMFSISDASDCSLTLDLSEENDLKLHGNKAARKDGAMASFMNDLQSDGNAKVGLSSMCSDGDDADSKSGLSKEKPVRSKDAVVPKRNSLKDKSSGSIKSTSGPSNHPRPVRTLNSSENSSMRKVVPISRSTKAAPPSCAAKKPETKPAPRDTSVAEARLSRRNSVRGTADATPKPQYRQSVSVEEPKFQRGTATSSSGHFEREQLQHKGSFKKPSSKPVRYVPKSKTDETKMCRSFTKSPTDPSKSTAVSIPKTPAPVPGFARNTVASSSKCAKVDLSTPSKAPTLTRSLSQRLPRMRMTTASDDFNPKENGGSTLKRANSARIIKRNTDNSELLSVKAEPVLKDQVVLERSTSLKCKDGNQTAIGILLNHF